MTILATLKRRKRESPFNLLAKNSRKKREEKEEIDNKSALYNGKRKSMREKTNVCLSLNMSVSFDVASED